MSMLTTLLLADSADVRKDKGNWVTINGRHIFIGSAETANASKKAYAASTGLSKKSPVAKLKEAAQLHRAAMDLTWREHFKYPKGSAEAKSLESQSTVHQKLGNKYGDAAMEAAPSVARATEPAKNLKGSDREVMQAAFDIGKKYFGSEYQAPDHNDEVIRGTLDSPRIKKAFFNSDPNGGKYNEASGSHNAKYMTSTQSFYFKPSTKKGEFGSWDQKLDWKHADPKDGKLYLQDNERVYVISPRKGKEK